MFKYINKCNVKITMISSIPLKYLLIIDSRIYVISDIKKNVLETNENEMLEKLKWRVKDK